MVLSGQRWHSRVVGATSASPVQYSKCAGLQRQGKTLLAIPTTDGLPDMFPVKHGHDEARVATEVAGPSSKRCAAWTRLRHPFDGSRRPDRDFPPHVQRILSIVNRLRQDAQRCYNMGDTFEPKQLSLTGLLNHCRQPHWPTIVALDSICSVSVFPRACIEAPCDGCIGSYCTSQ